MCREFNRVSARLQAGLLFLATIALLIPSAISRADPVAGAAITQKLSVGLAVLLIVAYGLGMLFSLKTHRELFTSAEHGEAGEAPWPIGLGPGHAGRRHAAGGIGQRSVCRVGAESGGVIRDDSSFVGFIVVALVGGAAEMASAFSGARKKPAGPERGHCIGERGPNRALCCASSVAGELFHRADADGFAILAWRGGDDFPCHPHRVARHDSGRSTWFVGVAVLMVYLIFAMTLYLLPPRSQ